MATTAPPIRHRNELATRDLTWVIAALVALGLFLVPLGHERLVVGQPAGVRNDLRVFLFPFDILIGAACVVAAPIALQRFRRAPWPLLALAALVVSTLLASFAHPSPQAAQLVLRLGACLLLALALTAMPLRRAAIALGGLGAAAVLQTVVAVAQRIERDSLGWSALGEYGGSLWEVGTEVAPRGTWVHHYMLAGWALVAVAACLVLVRAAGRWRFAAVVVAAVAAVPVGLTFSRAAGLSAAAVVVALALPGREAAVRRATAVVLAGSIGVTVLVVSGGWWERASAQGGDFSSERGEHTDESFELIRRHPIVGAGPGRYVYALQKEVRQEPGVPLAPVHNFVLLAAAESGIVGGLAATAFVVLLGLRALRGGPWSIAAYSSFAPNLMLDHFPYSTPHGLVMTAVWAATVLVLARRDGPTPQVATT